MSEPALDQDQQDLFGSVTDVNDFVGEGKKYRTPEDALKSIPHAQTHIQNLERQLEELRGTLSERMAQEKILEEIRAAANVARDPADGQADIAELVRNTAAAELPKLFSQLTQQDKAERNVAQVQAELVSRYGTPEKAKEVLANKARELGVSTEHLRNLASTSPKAVLAYFPSQNTDVGTSKGSLNQAAMGTPSASNPESYAYYRNLRKTNPTLYFDPKTQLAMQKAAIKAAQEGRNFYSE